REPLDEQQADEERGGRVAEERHPGQHIVTGRVPVHRLVHPEGYPEGQRHDRAQQDEHDGLGQVLGDQAGHRDVQLRGEAEVTLEDLAGPLEVLDVERLVKAVQMVVVGDLGDGRPRSEHRPDRPAGEQVNQRQRDHGHDEQHDDRLSNAPDQVSDHQTTTLRPGLTASAAAPAMSMLSLLPPALASHTLAGRLPPGLGGAAGLAPSYFVKFQYSGKMVNSALYLTFCRLFWTAMIS